RDQSTRRRFVCNLRTTAVGAATAPAITPSAKQRLAVCQRRERCALCQRGGHGRASLATRRRRLCCDVRGIARYHRPIGIRYHAGCSGTTRQQPARVAHRYGQDRAAAPGTLRPTQGSLARHSIQHFGNSVAAPLRRGSSVTRPAVNICDGTVAPSRPPSCGAKQLGLLASEVIGSDLRRSRRNPQPQLL
ncbi:MAG: hypothetical protein ACJA0V_001083, partial [Planctomycetota bacterium]